MAAFTPLSAKNAKVRIGSYVLTAKVWRVDPKGDAYDITNFEGGGYADWGSGILEAEFTVEGDWDSANDPYTNPPNLNVGTVISTVNLYTNGTSSASWNFPTALIIATPQNAEVRGYISFAFTAKAKGSFTSP